MIVEWTGNIQVHHPESKTDRNTMTAATVTDARAREIILAKCRAFVEETSADEPGHEWDNRVEVLAKRLDAEIGANISDKATSELREVLVTFEELQSVDAGTHWRIRKNRALTIDNTPDLRDELTNITLPEQLFFLLQVSGFRAAAEDVAA